MNLFSTSALIIHYIEIWPFNLHLIHEKDSMSHSDYLISLIAFHQSFYPWISVRSWCMAEEDKYSLSSIWKSSMTDPCHGFGANSWCQWAPLLIRKAKKPSRQRSMFVNIMDRRTSPGLKGNASKLRSVQDCGIILIRRAETILPLLCIWSFVYEENWCELHLVL